MTEAGWLACTESNKMLEGLRDNASERKLRLFAAACLRRIWRLIAEPESREAVEVAERYADGVADVGVLVDAYARPPHPHPGSDLEGCFAFPVASPSAYAAASHVPALTGADHAAHAVLLRCVFANPFRPATLDPAGRTADVLTLAQTAYENRTLPAGTLDRARLALLADALEDAGCADADILDHLRSEGPHVRGCWVVDFILGKQ